MLSKCNVVPPSSAFGRVILPHERIFGWIDRVHPDGCAHDELLREQLRLLHFDVHRHHFPEHVVFCFVYTGHAAVPADLLDDFQALMNVQFPTLAMYYILCSVVLR